RAIGAGAAGIAFDVNFNREVLRDSGRYFRTASDVSDAIEFAEQHPEQTRQLGRRARELAHRYDWDDVTSRYERLCESLVESGPRPRGVRPSGRRRGIESLNAVVRLDDLYVSGAGGQPTGAMKVS